MADSSQKKANLKSRLVTFFAGLIALGVCSGLDMLVLDSLAWFWYLPPLLMIILSLEGSQIFTDEESGPVKIIGFAVFLVVPLTAGWGLDQALDKVSDWFTPHLEPWEEEGYVMGPIADGKTYLWCGSYVVSIDEQSGQANVLNTRLEHLPQTITLRQVRDGLYSREDELITDRVSMCAWEKTLTYSTKLERTTEQGWSFSGRSTSSFMSSERLRHAEGFENEYNNKNCTEDAVIKALESEYYARNKQVVLDDRNNLCKSLPDDRSFDLKRNSLLETIATN